MKQKKLNEIQHGKKIAENAEYIWGWGTEAGKKRALRRADLILSKIDLTKNNKIIELGCGTGLFSNLFRKKIPDLISVDISFELQNIHKKKYNEATLFIMDVENLGVKDNSIDCFIGSSILHHLDIDIILKIMYKKLKPGGKIIFAEPNMLNPQIMLQKNIPFIKKMMGDSPDETAFIKYKLINQLKLNNFYKMEITPFDFLHPFLPKAFIPLVENIQQFLENCPLIKEIAGSLLIYAEK